ncbi:hypothetical protein B1218_34485, partial [Pseudomonas ogarae]
QHALSQLRLRQPELVRCAQSAEPVEPPAIPEAPLPAPRELAALELTAQGHSHQQIAEKPFTSLPPVKTNSPPTHRTLCVPRLPAAEARTMCDVLAASWF